jgi:2-amino-4-hydroxy-6-hydroxymethyldihydropteridine diphosphokinase
VTLPCPDDERGRTSRAYLGLGGNLGDVRAAIRRALATLEGDALRVLARSADYRTPAWGKTDQPAFINACAVVCTSYTPPELLARCQEVERALGRVRGERWGPRTIDIDVLSYEGRSYESDQLTLPHPDLLRRAFVLVPLAEIAPTLEIDGTRVADAVERVDRTGIERLAIDTAGQPTDGGSVH